MGFVQAYVQELFQLHVTVATNSIPKSMAWEPPEGNVIKMNFDASYNQQCGTSYSRVIA